MIRCLVCATADLCIKAVARLSRVEWPVWLRKDAAFVSSEFREAWYLFSSDSC